jgi:uncharacterized RDD family membrane protein YckC
MLCTARMEMDRTIGAVIRLGRLEVETPDHVTLRYDLAGAGNRGFAALIDFVAATLVLAGMVALWVVLLRLVGATTLLPFIGIFFLVAFAIAWSYFILLEWLWGGQTLGKRIYRLRVISADGSPASFTAVLIRNLLRLIDFLPAFYGLGLLAIVATSRSQRLGDVAAGTFVVRAPRPRIDLLALRTIAPAGPATMSVRGMSGELQRLVREFVARERTLAETDRRRVAAGIAAALRARIPDATATEDIALIHEVAAALRASGERT